MSQYTGEVGRNVCCTSETMVLFTACWFGLESEMSFQVSMYSSLPESCSWSCCFFVKCRGNQKEKCEKKKGGKKGKKKKGRRNGYWQLFTRTFKDVVETTTNTVWTLIHWVLGGQCIFSLLIDFVVSTAVLEKRVFTETSSTSSICVWMKQ